MPYENKFSVLGSNVLRYAMDIATEMGHTMTGSEHILLGLLKEKGGVAAKTLSAEGVSYDKVFDAATDVMDVNYARAGIRPSGLTPRAKHILELAYMEARRFGHLYISTEHILLAMLKESDGIAFHILDSFNIDLVYLYDKIEDICAGTDLKPKEKTVKKKSGTLLDQFTKNLTLMAAEGSIDPVIGRDKEVQRLMEILSRRNKNNPCLIGEPGVGKTAVAEGFAEKIAAGDIPETFKNKQVLTVDLSGMIAGTKYRGDFEERFKKLIDEAGSDPDIILFIDELHTVIGAGAAEGAVDAAHILKPVLARGGLQVIGATTLEEYRKYIEKDPALERRFQPVFLKEPSVSETVEIISGLKDRYEAHHKVNITDKAITAAAEYSKRYITDRFLPDKAIDLIDEAAARLNLTRYVVPDEIKGMEREMKKLKEDIDSLIISRDFEGAAELNNRRQTISEKYETEKNKWEEARQKTPLSLEESHIAACVEDMTGIPVTRLTKSESERLLNLEQELKNRVVGQNEAIEQVAKAIRRGRVGLKNPNRPTGSFIFAGPTGVGKTELTKALAQVLFGSDDVLIRVDMSEYMEKHSVSRLIGSPPGYVGYDNGGQLTEKVRTKPYSVILFDEIEKAHPDVFNTLLQVLEDGILTDGQGRTVDFKNTIIIMTSNVGARDITDKKTLGFGNGDKTHEDMKSKVVSNLKETFRPEFINRIDDIVVFHPLSTDEVKEIVENMLKAFEIRLKKRNISARFTTPLTDYIVKKGYDERYGARPARRVIQNVVEDAFAEKILSGEIKNGDSLTVDFKDNKVTFEADR